MGRAFSHGFPSTSALCVSQTRSTTNGHFATYFAGRRQRFASQSVLSRSGWNSGPRLFVSTAAPTLGIYTSMRRHYHESVPFDGLYRGKLPV
ncbi:MAG TPA: hypothetical protein VNO32_52935, partial [Candidatus Acidoferrum sp.]|nr:hypothetical protein [Candidatus Acidoferrum sp.]